MLKHINIRALETILNRFPVAVLITLCWFSFALLDLWSEHDYRAQDWPLQCAMVGVSASLFAAIFFEAQQASKQMSLAVSFLAAVLLAAAVYLLKTPEWLPYFVAGISFLGVFSAPYFAIQAKDTANWWQFQFRLLLASLIALVAALMFGAGLSLIVWSLEALFGITFFGKDKVYGSIWLISLALIFPLAFVNGIPRSFTQSFQFDKGQIFHAALLWFANLLCAPIVIVYGLIIHAYAIMILLQWDVPNGEAGWLNLWFLASVLFYGLLIEPIKPHLAKHAKKLLHYWPYLMPIPAVVLMVALNIRVAAYGITIDRYFVGILAVFCFGVFVFAQRTSRQRLFAAMPFALAALLILSSFGPWGAVDVSIASQVQRLEKLLKQNEIISASGRFAPLQQTSKTQKNADEIRSIVFVLAKMDSLSKIEPIFSNIADQPFSDFSTLKRNDVVEKLGVDYKRVNVLSVDGEPLHFSIGNRNILWDGTPFDKAIFNLEVRSRRKTIVSGVEISLEGTRLSVEQAGAIDHIDLGKLRELINAELNEDKKAGSAIKIETEAVILLITNASISPVENGQDNVTRLEGALLYKVR